MPSQMARSGPRNVTEPSGKLGLGTAALGNLYKFVSDAEASATLSAAERLNYHWIDTAPLYGHGLSERRIGKWIGSYKSVKLKISTKVGRRLVPATNEAATDTVFASPDPYRPVFDYSGAAIRSSIEDSLMRLGVSKVEAAFMHDLGEDTHSDDAAGHLQTALQSGFKELDRLKAEGTIRRIGIGVNEVEICKEILNVRDLDLILLAGRYTLLEHAGALEFLDSCHRHGVRVILGGVFNSGLLIDPDKTNARYNYQPVPQNIRAKAKRISEICKDYDVPIGAASLVFSASHPAVECVLVGARSVDEAARSRAWAEDPVPSELWDSLRAAGLLNWEAPVA